MPTETGVTSILGIENTANKDMPSGYAGLDANTLIASSELPLSIIPFGVSVAGFIPYMDDGAYLNLVYVESGYYIAFNDSTEKFLMVII